MSQIWRAATRFTKFHQLLPYQNHFCRSVNSFHCLASRNMPAEVCLFGRKESASKDIPGATEVCACLYRHLVSQSHSTCTAVKGLRLFCLFVIIMYSPQRGTQCHYLAGHPRVDMTYKYKYLFPPSPLMLRPSYPVRKVAPPMVAPRPVLLIHPFLPRS